MCTLCLSDMGELRDEWLREPQSAPALIVSPALFASIPAIPREPTAVARVAGPLRAPPAAALLRQASHA